MVECERIAYENRFVLMTQPFIVARSAALPGDVVYDPKLKGAPVLTAHMKLKRGLAEKYYENIVEELREKLLADRDSQGSLTFSEFGGQRNGSLVNIVK